MRKKDPQRGMRAANDSFYTSYLTLVYDGTNRPTNVFIRYFHVIYFFHK